MPGTVRARPRAVSHVPRRQPLRSVVDSNQGRSPFLFQLPYVALIVLVLAGLSVVAPDVLGHNELFVALSLVIVATTLALVVRWSRLPHWTVAVIPMLDIASVPFLRLSVDGAWICDLVIIPVIWMSAQYFLTGVAVSVLAATAAIWSVVLLGRTDPNGQELPQLVLLPAVIAVVGIAVALMSRRGGATQVMLEQQSRLTGHALERANRQQMVLHGILNAMVVGVVALDAEGYPMLVNRHHGRLLGRDFGGRMPTASDIEMPLYGADRTTRLRQDENPITRAKRGENFDHVLVWSDSIPRPDRKIALDVSARQMFTGSGEPAGAVLVFQDVTTEIEALRSREELTAAVSHELRTPLTSIMGYLSLLEEDEQLPPRSRPLVEVAASNADRLLAIVTDILTTARNGQGELSVEPREVDLVPLVMEGVRLIHARAQSAHVTVVADLPERFIGYADGPRLRQVIDNILSNAVKYGFPGGSVRVTLQKGPDQNGVIVIADDGIGIPADEQRKVFRRFYRAASVRDGRVHGTGLGLHISRTIMRQLGGEIALSSTPGVGTTVEISLPPRPVGPRQEVAVDA